MVPILLALRLLTSLPCFPVSSVPGNGNTVRRRMRMGAGVWKIKGQTLLVLFHLTLKLWYNNGFSLSLTILLCFAIHSSGWRERECKVGKEVGKGKCDQNIFYIEK